MSNVLKRKCGYEIAISAIYHLDYCNGQGKHMRNTTVWPFWHKQKPLKKVLIKFCEISIAGSIESHNAVSGLGQ